MVDALGNLIDFVLLPGQRHDLIGVAPLLDGVAFETLIADRAYGSNALGDELQERGATVVIPHKLPNKARHQVRRRILHTQGLEAVAPDCP